MSVGVLWGKPARVVLVVVLVVCAMIATGCRCGCHGHDHDHAGIKGSGTLDSVEHDVSGVTAVAVTNQGDLFIEFGDDEGLKIEAEDNLLQYITVKQSGSKLTIGTKKGVHNLKNTKPIRYYLTVRDLEKVTATSAGDIMVPEIRRDSFEATATSAGDITIEAFHGDFFHAHVTSAGDLSVNGGEVAVLDVAVSSAGDFDGRDLKAIRADVSVSSAGDAAVWVTEHLDASLSSVGDLRYRGDPELDVSRSSHGNIIRLGS
jgi:hypothetical protein